jgi:hypothetical protein
VATSYINNELKEYIVNVLLFYFTKNYAFSTESLNHEESKKCDHKSNVVSSELMRRLFDVHFLISQSKWHLENDLEFCQIKVK